MAHRYESGCLIPGYEDLSPEDQRREYPEEEDVEHAKRWIMRFARYKREVSK